MNDAIANEIRVHIRTLPLKRSARVHAKHEILDSLGTQLWNFAAKFARSPNFSTHEERNICCLYVFSFLVLDTAAQNGDGNMGSMIRMFRTALKASRCCLVAEEYDLCRRTLEGAASYDGACSAHVSESESYQNLYLSLRAQYQITRVALVSLVCSIR